MPQFGGKDSKRHFTVVMGGKEHGLYVSSSPSSAAKKAVTKLCTANKSKKVEFHIREITQGSKKKTYGPYEGHIEKLKEPIELKGRVIKYKPVAKLSGKSGAKKGGMRGGANKFKIYNITTGITVNGVTYSSGVIIEDLAKNKKYFFHNSIIENAYGIYKSAKGEYWDGNMQEFNIDDDQIDKLRERLIDPDNEIIILL
jgi:hypothetical protein